MYYVYILKSKITDFYYKGFCEDLQKRLRQHNAGMTKSNKPYIPFEIKYYEICNTIEEAIKKEKYWKTAAGRKYLKDKIQ